MDRLIKKATELKQQAADAKANGTKVVFVFDDTYTNEQIDIIIDMAGIRDQLAFDMKG